MTLDRPSLYSFHRPLASPVDKKQLQRADLPLLLSLPLQISIVITNSARSHVQRALTPNHYLIHSVRRFSGEVTKFGNNGKS